MWIAEVEPIGQAGVFPSTFLPVPVLATPMSKRFFRVLTVLTLGVFLSGCKPQEQIKVDVVPRTTAPRKPVDAKVVASQLDHTLAAIVPQGKKAWFFKLAGPAPAIDRQREAFVEFLSTVKLAEDAAETPTWKIPEPWQEQPASEMRAATLVIPDEQGPLEIAVSSLPLSGKWEDFVVPNVNRWLRQLREPPLDEEAIFKLTKQVELQNGSATLIELVGRSPKKMASNPHAGIPGAPPLGATQPTQQPPASDALTYETPAGWLPGKMSSMRKAAFRVVEGEAEAEVTVIDLPASGGEQVAQVEANIRRWAGQVGLVDLDAEALQKMIKPIKVDGSEGSYAELFSPEAAERQLAIFGAMVVRDGKVWFFKMTGDVDLVKSQQSAIRKFLASVKFGKPLQ